MRLTILAVGRAKRGPEQTLVAEYLKRLQGAGRGVGLGPARLVEVEAKAGLRGDALQTAEAGLLLEKRPPGARLAALDERGDAVDSLGFAALLARWRDDSAPEAVFALGGADGHAPRLRDQADRLISFGPMTWPHMLARVMVSEQLYRAATLLSGHPYHRG